MVLSRWTDAASEIVSCWCLRKVWSSRVKRCKEGWAFSERNCLRRILSRKLGAFLFQVEQIGFPLKATGKAGEFSG